MGGVFWDLTLSVINITNDDMKKVNFKKFEVYTGISRQKKITGDARKDFADLIYQHTIGIEAHALAFKIYNSEEPVAITGKEEQLIVRVANEWCTPMFIDGLIEQLRTEV